MYWKSGKLHLWKGNSCDAVVRTLSIFLLLILFVGCVADEIHNPIAGAESPALIYVPRGDSEATISVEDASAESSSTEIALPTPMERFEQITSRPLSEWTTQEFSELLSVSSREVDLNIANNIGFEHFVFDIMGAIIGFPNGTYYMIESEYPRGFLIFEKYKSDDVVTYPLIVTVVCEEQSILLGADLGGNVGDIMDVFGQTEIEYVGRDVGREKEHFYFVRYSIDGLVFLFDCGVPTELRRISSHPTINKILACKLWYVNILEEDCYLLEQLDASILNVKTKTD